MEPVGELEALKTENDILREELEKANTQLSASRQAVLEEITKALDVALLSAMLDDSTDKDVWMKGYRFARFVVRRALKDSK